MRILHVCEYNQYIGGTEQYILSLSDYLERCGHYVSIIYGRKAENIPFSTSRTSYFLPELMQLNGKLSSASAEKLDKILKYETPDIVYLHNIFNYAFAKKIYEIKPALRYIHDHRSFCPKSNKMFFFTGSICHKPCSFFCLLKAYSGLCLPGFPRPGISEVANTIRALNVYKKMKILVASEYMRTCLLYNGFSPSNVSVLPYFCNFKKPMSQTSTNEVLFVGQLERHKGVQYLIKSMLFWPEQLRLVIIGSGYYETKMKLLAKKMHLENKIDFLGALPNAQIQQYYEKCLCVVIPSLWGEPFGIVGLEAMACGKPVVAFNVGGIPEWLEDNKTGYLAERKNIVELAKKISFLFTDKNQAYALGLAGHKRYYSCFTPEKHINLLLKIFEEVIKNYRDQI